jgi:pentose-5-phosphate-3-epimerase
MSLYEDLDAVLESPADSAKRAKVLLNFYTTYDALDELKYSTDVLRLVQAEITTKNRESFIERLMGRYRKLRALEDQRNLEIWRARHG